jgi:uncharacterized delta-60 repeat protein
MTKLNRLVAPCLLSLALTSANNPADAAAGSLDPTFGKGGVVVTTLTTAGEGNAVIPYSILLQSNGEILVLANVIDNPQSTTDMLRYTSAGVLDKTFGKNGIAVLATAGQDLAESMALQANGQIVVAGVGTSGFTVERLNTDGTADTSFGTDGVATVSVSGRGIAPQLVLLVETDGNILLGGQLEPTGRHQPFQTVLARLDSSGALDPTFGTNGTTIVTAPGGCTALAELSTGEILDVNAQDIAQFTSTGSLESTVTGGTLVASAGSENPSTPSVFQPNGDYLLADELFVGEESRAHNASTQVLRFTSTGAADPTFANPSLHFVGAGGAGIEAIPNGIAVQSDGKIVVVGLQSTSTQSGTTIVNGLARLLPSGDLDSTFGNDGTVTNQVPSGTQGLEGVVIQPNGDFVVVGTANTTALAVSRYLGQ